MNRTIRREQIFKILYRAEFFEPDQMEDQCRLYFESGDQTFTPADQAYIMDHVRGILDKLPELDGDIGAASKNWSFSRIGKVELAILRQALYSIRYDDDVSTVTAIVEAVEMAKKFGQDGAGAYVNGVLAQFADKK